MLYGGWSAAYDLLTVLIAVQKLLKDPEIESAINEEATQLFLNNKAEYAKRVRNCLVPSSNDGNV